MHTRARVGDATPNALTSSRKPGCRASRPRSPPSSATGSLYYAWRAPSPHNAQGWRIEAEGTNFRVSAIRPTRYSGSSIPRAGRAIWPAVPWSPTCAWAPRRSASTPRSGGDPPTTLQPMW